MTKLQANGGHAALEIHGLQYASSEWTTSHFTA